MKRILIACALVVATSAADAQENGASSPVTLGILAGGESMSGAFRSEFRSSFLIGAMLQFALPARQFAIRADVMYHALNEYPLCSGGSPCYAVTATPYLVSSSLSFVARLNRPAIAWSPYAIAGVAVYQGGYASYNVSLARPGRYGLEGGVGFEARAGASVLFVEMRFMSVPPAGVEPLTLGARFFVR